MEGSGQDPLGLTRVSNEFTGFLLPSIITITPRARYFSFYTWAIRECRQAFEEGDSRTFDERLRCIDTAFAISSRLGRTTDLTITGVDKVNAKLPDPSSEEPIDVLFPVLPSSERGAFGQAYGSSIDHLGLIQWTEEEVWKLRPGRGDKLATAFSAAIRKTPYVLDGHISGQWIPPSVLRDSAKSFSLDGIREPGAKAEREILTRIFFDLDDEVSTIPRSHRQATLGLLLHVLTTYDEIGSLPNRRDINSSCIFWPHYYGGLYVDGAASVPYQPNVCFEETREYWRQFCLHQFFLYAAEQFLQAMLDAMATQPDGVTKDGMLEAMLRAGFIEDLERVMERKASGPSELLDFFRAGDPPESVQQHFSCDHPLSEGWIHYQDPKADDPEAPVTRLGRAFAIWAQLYAKWRNSDDPALVDVAERANQEWWVGTLFEWGDQWHDEKPDWLTTLRRLIDLFVSRHEQIRFHKGKLDAAWFEVLGGRFSQIQDLTPDFRASRHPQVATVFQDLCLLEDGNLNEPLKPTEWGRQILNEVISSRS
jgi:hypothetical protein